MADERRGRGRPRKAAITTSLLSPEDVALLTASELEALQQDAEKEATEEHLELVREKAKKIFKEKHRRRLLSKSDPNEGMRDIFLDLAPHSDKIMLDGTQYFHGTTYHVTKAVYDTLAEVMSRGWDHEREVGNANQKQYKAPRNLTITPRSQGVPAAQLMRV